MKIILACLITVLFFSCGSQPNESDNNATENKEEIVKAEANHNATSQFSIEGMTCEIGCVRTVKSHLSKMAGVIDIKMDFDTSRAVDYSTVQFDNSIVTEAEMQAEIESIANGIYAVTEVAPQKL